MIDIVYTQMNLQIYTYIIINIYPQTNSYTHI